MITHLSEWAKRKPQAPFFCVQGDKQSIEYSYKSLGIILDKPNSEVHHTGLFNSFSYQLMQVHTSHRMPNFFGGIVNNGDVSIYRFESQVASLSKKINF